jgi:hypothetical protein
MSNMETIDIIFDNFMSNYNFNQILITCFWWRSSLNHEFYQTHKLRKATTQKHVFSKFTFLKPQTQKQPQYQI